MKFFRLAFLFAMLHLATSGALRAQYLPDTSLTYPLFLQQAQAFAANEDNGEAWVVSFWATWNRASLYAIPRLKEVHREFTNEPFRFISISIDKNRLLWEQQLKRFTMPWEQLFVPDESNYRFLKRAFRHNSLPATYLIYPDGSIFRVKDTQELRDRMERLSETLEDRPFDSDPQPDPFADDAGDDFPLPDRDDTEADPLPELDDAEEEELPPIESETTTYTVRPGDTLYSLHKRFNVSVEALRRANNLSGNTIKVGQKLTIPQS